jgi:hypothetical protein
MRFRVAKRKKHPTPEQRKKIFDKAAYRCADRADYRRAVASAATRFIAT